MADPPPPDESLAPLPADPSLSQNDREPAPMDIHKPKPVHNLREFLSEIVVIVIGVLIALGLEQAVEAWHWHEQVEQERTALRAAIDDAQNATAFRALEQVCITKRLDEVNTIFERHKAGLPLGIIGPLERPIRAAIAVGTWQIAVAGQGLDHMPLKEKLAFDEQFNSFEGWNDAVNQEQSVWTRLSLIDHRDLLTEQDWSNLRIAYAEATTISKRFTNNMTDYLEPRYRAITDVNKLDVSRAMKAGYRAICTPMINP